MPDESNEVNFDKSRAELFDALGHPVRIRILRALEEGPLGFSDLRRKVELDSGGHLQFHLGKLDGLVTSGQGGNYAITNDGREALRVIDSERGQRKGNLRSGQLPPLAKSLLVGLVAAIVVLSVFAGMAYSQLSSQIGAESQENTLLTQQLANATQELEHANLVAQSLEQNNASLVQQVTNLTQQLQQTLSNQEALLGTSIPVEFPSGLPLIGSANGTAGSLVFVMQSNAVATITYTYTREPGFVWNGTIVPSVGLWETSLGGFNFTQTPDVSVTATPGTVNGNQTTTVVFTFSSKATAKGLYLFDVPMACTWIPFAVGLTLTQIENSSLLFVQPACPLYGYDGSIAGLSGLNYAYIQM
jgi:DNA-binding transcriptional ArsR family regulator